MPTSASSVSRSLPDISVNSRAQSGSRPSAAGVNIVGRPRNPSSGSSRTRLPAAKPDSEQVEHARNYVPDNNGVRQRSSQVGEMRVRSLEVLNNTRPTGRRRLLLPPRENAVGDFSTRRARGASTGERSIGVNGPEAVSGEQTTRLPLLVVETPKEESTRLAKGVETDAGARKPETGAEKRSSNEPATKNETSGSDEALNAAYASTEPVSNVTEHRSSLGGRYMVVRPWGSRIRSNPDLSGGADASNETDTDASARRRSTSSRVQPTIWRVNSAGEIVRTLGGPPQPVEATLCRPPSSLASQISLENALNGTYTSPNTLSALKCRYPTYAAPFRASHSFAYASTSTLALDDPFHTMVMDAPQRRLIHLASRTLAGMAKGLSTTTATTTLASPSLFIPLPLLRWAAIDPEEAAQDIINSADSDDGTGPSSDSPRTDVFTDFERTDVVSRQRSTHREALSLPGTARPSSSVNGLEMMLMLLEGLEPLLRSGSGSSSETQPGRREGRSANRFFSSLADRH
ncbi:uncharacterized protein EV422DRAFT_507784 [Fimicolochytrium jonesii]|uniref:uncharacterized protein n=1 Tax=Fimicolochytrium jonesii TaxID=1396493 RepID=UPI0022FDE760|nr:uncharacterized protein EV422DRAFT_507784 [Fimicolochytrium jonesii]KAI8818967.1 hypothetical protein EV422DRAFT_507784 [Fimicolochytrium jonesii]